MVGKTGKGKKNLGKSGDIVSTSTHEAAEQPTHVESDGGKAGDVSENEEIPFYAQPDDDTLITMRRDVFQRIRKWWGGELNEGKVPFYVLVRIMFQAAIKVVEEEIEEAKEGDDVDTLAVFEECFHWDPDGSVVGRIERFCLFCKDTMSSYLDNADSTLYTEASMALCEHAYTRAKNALTDSSVRRYIFSLDTSSKRRSVRFHSLTSAERSVSLSLFLSTHSL
jgi:hypothetical protein